jgi:hypothetical protein
VPLGAWRSVQPWPSSIFPAIGFPAGAANQPRRTWRPEHPLARLVGALVCCEGLSGSCHETVTSVKRPTAHDHSQGSHRSPRSPVGSWTTARSRRPVSPRVRLREYWRCQRLPAAEIHDQGEHDDDRSDQGYDERFVSPFPAGEAGDRQRRPTRKLMNTEAAKYRTSCWSRAPAAVATMIRKAGPRDARRRRSGPFYFLACSK